MQIFQFEFEYRDINETYSSLWQNSGISETFDEDAWQKLLEKLYDDYCENGVDETALTYMTDELIKLGWTEVAVEGYGLIVEE